jgi:ABC-type multidrug transport system fused ATPase/permease subunit
MMKKGVNTKEINKSPSKLEALMAYLLRFLLIVMVGGISLTAGVALGWLPLQFGHIQLAIPTFMFTIFIQAFVMFYFIGVSRLVENVWNALNSEGHLNELFDEAPTDLEPYKKRVARFVHESQLSKRQTIPWTMLMLILGTIAFLLGGAHDTGMVSKVVHSGVAYGFISAMGIGFVRQWHYLGKSHVLLGDMKSLFGMSRDAM